MPNNHNAKLKIKANKRRILLRREFAAMKRKYGVRYSVAKFALASGISRARMAYLLAPQKRGEL
ncbi:MAG: hypothetical protein ABIU85_09575 [Methylotenera sp.]